MKPSLKIPIPLFLIPLIPVLTPRRLPLSIKLSLTALFVALFAGCPSQPTTTSTTTSAPMGQTLSIGCPTITDPAPTCPGIAFTESKLTCRGPIKASFDSTHPNRIGVTVPDGSTVTGNVRGTSAIAGPCHGIGARFAIVITFGAQYTGDIGPNAPICIARSKLVFTQFDVGGSIFNAAWNPTIKSMIQDKVQLEIDQAVVDQLNASPGLPPRCASFTELP